MNTLKQLFLICCGLIYACTLSAQNMSGKVTDEQQQPLSYANIVFLSLPDSAFVAGAVSGEDGSFSLSAEGGKGVLKVSCIGYTTLYKECGPGEQLSLQLKADAQLLDEVVVKGDLPVTRIKDATMITNIENTVLSKAGSANDVLLKIPGIIKEGESYKVIGKGVPLIYINGQQVRDLSELEQLNSEDIKNIEVNRNPGAHYDATVKAVVRISTLKPKGEGLGMNLRSSYYQSENTDWVEQADFNYRKKGWDVFGRIKYDKIKTEQHSQILQTIQATQKWEHHNSADFENENQLLKADVGINFTATENHAAGIKYTLGEQLTAENFSETKNQVMVAGQYYDYLHSRSAQDTDGDLSHQLNMYYNGKIGKVNIDFNADYFQSGFSQQTLTNEESASMDDRQVHAMSNVKNHLTAGKLILSIPVGKGRISVGSEVSYTHRKDDYLNIENYVPTSYSKIEEINTAAFAEYRQSFPWGNWVLGMRYEHVKFDYFENDQWVDSQSRLFDNFFPNVSFGTRLGAVYANLSYTVKNRRPSYRQLSNNVTYLDRYSMQTGDPALRPTIIHDVTLTGAWRFLQGGVSYIQMKDWIFYWGDIMNESTSQLLLRYRNWEKPVPSLIAFISATPTIGCWSPMLQASIQKQWLTIEWNGGDFSMNTPIFRIAFNNTWELPQGFMISMDAWMQSKGASQNVYLEKIKSSVDVSIRKSFLKDTLSVELKGTDLIDTNRECNFLRSGYYSIYQENTFDRREFSLTIRYKFNATKSKYKGTGAGSSQKSRM